MKPVVFIEEDPLRPFEHRRSTLSDALERRLLRHYARVME
jgi:hypothetical protein